ncbi:MAG: serpin family protein [Firmicutes bacterium]|nr:serpin family protein [Bacillota bacterium]
MALLLVGCEPPPKAPAKPEEVKELAKSSNRFALKLYREFSKEPGNLIFSPYGIYEALAMSSAGASGQTQQELKAILHTELPEPRLSRSIATLDDDLIAMPGWPKAKIPSIFHSFNGLWLDRSVPLQKPFVKMLKADFRVRPESLELKAKPQMSIDRINGWAFASTEGRIPKILDHLSPDARLLLANAVYFKGGWFSEFLERNTKREPFFLLEGGRSQTALMHQTGAFDYTEAEGCQALGMEFLEGPFQMVFLLPERRHFKNFEASLTMEKLSDLFQQMSKGHNEQLVNVTLPRFKFEAPAPVQEALQRLGLCSPFQKSADFSRLSTRPLWINEIYHRAFISVDEKGAEAAAVTAISIDIMSANDEGKPRIVNFKADHPFLFLIRDRTSGAVLFMGRCLRP